MGKPQAVERWWSFAFRQLPLQNESTTFILVNVLDIFVTYSLIRFGGIEANPIARYFLQRWEFQGLVYFKMSMVAFLVVLVQVIARSNLGYALRGLQLGIVIVTLVVVYSCVLFVRHFGS